MTGDVIEFGDERPPRAPGGRPRARSVLGGAVAVALLAAGIAGALRSPASSPDAAPSPSPSVSRTAGWTDYPDAPEAFEVFVSAHRPAQGEAFPLLMPGGVPALLVGDGSTPNAYVAIGGPRYARVLLGWCAKNLTLQSADGRYQYTGGLPNDPTLPPLRAFPVRDSEGADGHVDIGATPAPEAAEPAGGAEAGGRCETGELVLPSQPGTSDDVLGAGNGYARIRGRYVVSMESRAFCPAAADRACDAAGWEEYGPHTVLPPGDLASAYLWEGEFVVRADPTDGSLEVVLTPGSRLVRREHVGVAVRAGWAESYDRVGGALRLAFNPFRGDESLDDSPAGTPRPESYGLVDERGGLVRYTLAAGAEVYLGGGRTGLGKPRGTQETLRDHLRRTKPYEGPPLWLVLDSRGRVIRVVLAAA